jgi:hypothetical protein
VISSGWEISDRWLAFTSMVLAPMRLAIKRSRSGLMVRSSVHHQAPIPRIIRRADS